MSEMQDYKSSLTDVSSRKFETFSYLPEMSKDNIRKQVEYIVNQGWNPADIAHTAQGIMNQTLNTQASILAYTDVFAICAILAFAVVPVCFLFRGSKAGGGGAPAH